MITDFLKSQVGIVMISIIWGLGLATLFKKSCEGKDCKIIEFRGPPVNDIKSHMWTYGGDQCYRVKPYITKCNE